jgi:hypothetical protein
MDLRSCKECGAPLPPASGRGRPVERCPVHAIERIRNRGRKEPKVQATRYAPGPSSWEWMASELRRRGIEADALRLQEQSAAIKSRRKLDAKADAEHVRNLAIALKKAKRAQAVAHGLWAMSPTASNRQALAEAAAARQEARAALLEACLQDQGLVDDVMRSVS